MSTTKMTTSTKLHFGKLYTHRRDLIPFLTGININSLDYSDKCEFHGFATVAYQTVKMDCVCGGFGAPHIILKTIQAIDLGLMESENCENYEQCGGDPIQCSGWAFRESDTNGLLTADWSDERFDTAADALEAALFTLA